MWISFAWRDTCGCSRRGSCSRFPAAFSTFIHRCCCHIPGSEAQEQAFAYGVKVSGCTVHFVDEELDHGAIIVQKTVPVLDSRCIERCAFAARIIEQEHVAYTEAINIVLAKRF